MYCICTNKYIYTYLIFHTTSLCYFLRNKALIVSVLSSINKASYCFLLILLLMCALVQVSNLNILFDIKEEKVSS